MITAIHNIVDTFVSVSLEEMGKSKLMDRIDTKYILPLSRIPDLLHMMKKEYRILEINDLRIPEYETIYLDTPDYDFFNQHVTGRSGRIKVRYRKYESNGKSFLEIKKKTNKGRTIKWRIENDYAQNIMDDLAEDFISLNTSIPPDTLRPVLNSRFKRMSFKGSMSVERITIDFGLSYSINGGIRTELPLVAVAELKTDDQPMRTSFALMMRQLSVQPAGFSKYCTGIALLSDQPRINILKPKIMLLNRIENEYNRAISA
jgi:SPX domain protein involved in polyphosphate accumulation